MKTHSHAWYWKSEPAICIHLQQLISIFTAFFTLSNFVASELSRISGYGGVAHFFDQAVFTSSPGTVSWQTVLCDQDRWRDEWFFPEFLGTNHLHSGGSTSPQYHNRRAQPTWKLLTLQEVRVTHRLEEKKSTTYMYSKNRPDQLCSQRQVWRNIWLCQSEILWIILETWTYNMSCWHRGGKCTVYHDWYITSQQPLGASSVRQGPSSTWLNKAGKGSQGGWV